MKITTNGRDIYVEDATELEFRGGSWRNLGGAERKNKITGKIVNSEGNRNFCLFMKKDQAKIFEENNVKVTPYGGDMDSGEEPEWYFISVKVNTTTSKNPPVIYIQKKNGKREELTPDLYSRVDSMTVKSVDMSLNFWFGSSAEHTPVYANLIGIIPQLNPIQEKWQAMDEIADADDMGVGDTNENDDMTAPF